MANDRASDESHLSANHLWSSTLHFDITCAEFPFEPQLPTTLPMISGIKMSSARFAPHYRIHLQACKIPALYEIPARGNLLHCQTRPGNRSPDLNDIHLGGGVFLQTRLHSCPLRWYSVIIPAFPCHIQAAASHGVDSSPLISTC